jgi:hypothetical protein
MENVELSVAVSRGSQESPTDLPAMVEKLRTSSPQDQTSHWLGAGIEIIQEKQRLGFFNEETKPQADKAILYQGGDVNTDSSESLRATLHCLNLIGGDEANKTYGKITQYLNVQYDKNLYSPDEWQEKLAQATPEEKVRLESEGLFGFVFPEEDEKSGAETTQSAKEELPVDKIITEKLSFLEKKGRLTEGEQQLIGKLRLAKEARGEAGVLIKASALRDLKTSGVVGLDNEIENLEGQALIASNKLTEHLKEQGWSEDNIKGFIDGVSQGNIENMIKEGKFPKVEGLDRLFFGRELNDEELQRLLDPEKKKKWSKDALLIVLLMSAMSSFTFVQEVSKTR